MMTCTKLISAALSVTLLAAAAPQAAQRPFQETITVTGSRLHGRADHALTFSAPVGLPGVALRPGTYVFRDISDNTLQVAGEDGTPYAMFLTVPASRPDVTYDYAIVVDVPAAPGAPRRILAMFAPGEQTGRQFIYSR